MKKLTAIAVLITAATFFIGCPKKPTIVKEEAKAPVVETKVDTSKAEAEAKAKAEALKLKAAEEAKAKAEAEAKALKAKEEAEAKARAEALAKKEFRFEDVHFEYDKYDIGEKDRETLKKLADWLQANKEVRIQIEGHCDERGTEDYNLALGERRAHSIKQYLVNIGVGANKITTITFGKEKPVCTESTEECWWKNRRGHFVLQDGRMMDARK